MLLNLFSWLLISLVVWPFGHAMLATLGIKRQTSYSIILLLGAFLLSIILVVLAFFIPIDGSVFTGGCLLAATGYVIYRRQFSEQFKTLSKEWNALSGRLKLVGLILVFLTGLWAALPTNVPDHGLYYLQTVKWIAAEGFKENIIHYGLALGQQSPWHVLQAFFNNSVFGLDPTYTLNGWLLLLAMFYFLPKTNFMESWSGRYAMATLVVLPLMAVWTTAPAPDLPVWICSLILLDPANFKDAWSDERGRVAFGLAMGAFFFKATAFYLLLLVVVMTGKKTFQSRHWIIGVFVMGLLIVKNIWVSSSPFFPFADPTGWFVSEPLDVAIYKEAADTKAAFKAYLEQSHGKHGFWQVGYRWLIWLLSLGGLVLLGWMAFVKESSLKKLFGVFVACLILVFALAPVFRFVLGLTLPVFLILLTYFWPIWSKWFVLLPVLVGVLWLTPIRTLLLGLSANPIVYTYYPLSVDSFIRPAPSFRLPHYEQSNCMGRPVFVTPPNQYCWDGPLPCLLQSHYQAFCPSAQTTH